MWPRLYIISESGPLFPRHHEQGYERFWLKTNVLGTSLAVEWLRPCASTAGGAGSIPARGTKILYAAWCGPPATKVLKAQNSTTHKRSREPDSFFCANFSCSNGNRFHFFLRTYYVLDVCYVSILHRFPFCSVKLELAGFQDNPEAHAPSHSHPSCHGLGLGARALLPTLPWPPNISTAPSGP